VLFADEKEKQMLITTTVNLEDGDSFAYTAEAAAQQVLAALGGNPTEDYATVFIQQSTHGDAGVPPPVEIPA
jgi:hypothetical protein